MANDNSSSGIGMPAILFLIFLVLKLTGYIDWSWWWVTAPMWAGVILFLIVVILVAIAKASDNRKK
jgi:phosphoglycerol transferase MdoB-like AlkP superfamily enzyme